MVEMVLLAPVLLLFVLMVIFGGRWAIAQQAVQAAASEAARAASLARAPADAAGNATSAATTSLSNQKVRCAPLGATVDTTGFAVRGRHRRHGQRDRDVCGRHERHHRAQGYPAAAP